MPGPEESLAFLDDYQTSRGERRAARAA